MKKIKDQFIINKHNDEITIYDIYDDVFYELNASATIVFENMDLDENELVDIFKMNYEENNKCNFLEDILEIKKSLIDFFE